MVSGFFFVFFEFYAVVSVPFPFFGFPPMIFIALAVGKMICITFLFALGPAIRKVVPGLTAC